MLRVAEIVKKKYGVRTIKYTSAKKIKEEYGMALFELINEAYDQLYGYSPLSRGKLNATSTYISPILRLRMCLIVASNEQARKGEHLYFLDVTRFAERAWTYIAYRMDSSA